MLRALVRSFVLCEAVIGVTLSVLVLLGRTDPMTLANTLSVAGLVLLANGLALQPSYQWRYFGPIQRTSLTHRSERVLRAVFQAAIVIGTGIALYFIRKGV